MSVRLKSRPKLQTDRPITQRDPGNIVPRSAKLQTLHATPRTTTAREPGNKASRPRNPFCVPRSMHPSEPGKNVPRPAENSHRPNLNPLDHAGRPQIRPTPTVPTRPRSDCPADRPDRPSQRRGRPEALFEAQTYVFKPGLTLSRL
ncbi:unnamed protein product [Microthlaspi erraticum]|uniref:Uncharacterized protein n=1 Tax=Microthlaspi erraticum TaxID=1685480 RepID=A0A6D2IHU2_9BRAS|nr:unnamed protein product [Microthlaspi erraticum]